MRNNGGRRSSGWNDNDDPYDALRICGTDSGAAASVPSWDDGYKGSGGGVGEGDTNDNQPLWGERHPSEANGFQCKWDAPFGMSSLGSAAR